MNKLFINITKSLNLKENQVALSLLWKSFLKNYFFVRPSIDKIRKTYENNKYFFEQVREETSGKLF